MYAQTGARALKASLRIAITSMLEAVSLKVMASRTPDYRSGIHETAR